MPQIHCRHSSVFPSSCFPPAMISSTSLFASLNLSSPHLQLQSLSSKASPSSSPTLQFPSKPNSLILNRPPHLTRRLIPLAIDLTAGNPEDPSVKVEINVALDLAHDLFDKLPPPVKSFPWAKTLENFLKIVLDLALAAGKYLVIPVLALRQLSEMSYCAHERRMVLVPVPVLFLVGIAVAGVMKDTAVKLSSEIKEGGFQWHLLIIAIFFALLKLPGPYYSHWARLLIPHFANGGLWSVWLAFMWYKGSWSSSIGDHNQPGP